MFFKTKYIVVFVQKQGNSYKVIKKKRVKPDIETVRFKKGIALKIEISHDTYSRNSSLYYFIDIEKGQLLFEKVESNPKPKTTDMIIYQSIASQLTRSLEEKKSSVVFMNILTGLGIGLFIGYLIGGFL